MSKSIDWDSYLPSGAEAAARLAEEAPHIFTCPSGHGLPYRTPRGRCSAFDCADPRGALPSGAKPPSEALEPFSADWKQAHLDKGMAKEAAEILKRKAAAQVRAEEHEFPAFPGAPSLAKLGPRAWV